ncbi:hypothetical protein [Amycolatopsis methanolica]|uniref:hypothetical protein n=1 Tax=Amycolatopsis methanolica TaxID=1814 RepID=UPI003435F7A7
MNSSNASRRDLATASTGTTSSSSWCGPGHLDLVGGPAANGQPFLDLAARHISSAERLAEVSPDSAFLLPAKAAQLIGSGLLARQGLRPALSAPEQVVGTAVAAQFGHQFSQVELLRQRAGELDMPTSRDSHILPSEAKTYLGTVRTLLAAAREVAGKLALFH